MASTTYKVDNGKWVDWLTDMPETGATYMGRTGKWLTLYVTVTGHLQRTDLSRHTQCHHALPYVVTKVVAWYTTSILAIR